MEIWHSLTNAINSISPEAWSVIVQSVFSALIVSPLFVGVKKLLGIDDPKRREKVMMLLVMLGSLGAAFVAYMLSVPQFAAWIVFVQGLLTFSLTQPWYIFGVKPLSARLGAWFTSKIAEAAVINEAKAAAVPPGGLPISAIPPATEDFSH